MEQIIESYPVPCGHTGAKTHWVHVKYDEDRDTRVLWYLLDVISQFAQWDKIRLSHAIVSVAEHEGNVTVVVDPAHYNDDVRWALEASCGDRMGCDDGSVVWDQWNLYVEIDGSKKHVGGDSCH